MRLNDSFTNWTDPNAQYKIVKWKRGSPLTPTHKVLQYVVVVVNILDRIVSDAE